MKHKPLKANKTAHTPNTKKGMGDFYGIGVKNPMAKSKDVFGMETLKPRALKKPPKSLA